MLNSIWTRILAAFVLIGGLASCSPDKKTRDVYNPGEPQIRIGGKRLSIQTWNQTGQKRVDLRDTLDLSDARPARMHIKTFCKVDGIGVSENFTFDAPRSIAIFKFVPEKLLSLDLRNSEVDCAFELNLFNAAGSNHIYSINQISINSQRDGQVVIENQHGERLSTAIATPILSLASLSQYRIRGPYFESESIQAVCAALQTVAIRAGQAQDLGAISWEVEETRHTAEQLRQLERNPIQLCRLVVRNSVGRLDLSPPFKVRIPSKTLVRVLRSEQPGHCDLAEEHCKREVRDAIQGRPLSLQQWQLTNTGTTPRYVQIPKWPLKLAVRTLLRKYDRSAHKDYVDTQELENLLVKVSAPSGVDVKQTSSLYMITLKPDQSARITIYFRAELGRETVLSVQGLILIPKSPMRVVEVNEFGERLRVLTLKGRQRHYDLYTNGEFDTRTRNEWPSRVRWN